MFFSLLPFIVSSLPAHEFWLEPDKFIYQRTETVNIRLLTGERFDGVNWTDDKDRISCLELYYDNVVDRNLDANIGNDKGDSLQLAMIDEGTVMVTLNTKNSLADADTNELDAYLKDNDLTGDVLRRQKNGDTTNNDRESSQRSVKTIFQVGDRLTNVYNNPTELPLDIVPLSHPYDMKREGAFRVQVYFMGNKLKHARINIWHKLKDKTSQEDAFTDDDGEAEFSLSPQGEWMISCVKIVPLENNTQAEWQSYRGSLTWGYY